VALLLALVFATKAAVFPLGFWLPNSYPVPPAATSAFFGAVLTKVGVYALVRSFTLMFPEERGIGVALLVLAGVTMLVGALGAIARQRWRHAVAFANVASIGYLVAAVFSGTHDGLAAGVYYMLNSVAGIFALFVLAALAERIAGPGYRNPGHLGAYPLLGAGFFVSALAVAGLPPTSGFIGKFGLVRALLGAGGPVRVAVTVVAVSAGLLLLYAMMQIWMGFFWGESDAVHRVPQPPGMQFVAGAAVSVLLGLALFAGPLYRAAEGVAAQLDGNAAYLEAVLRPDAPPREGGY